MSSAEKERIVERLLIENYKMYYRMALGYVHNEADALDIVQEGAYKAILKSDTLRDAERAATWIYRIMLNEVFGFCRGRKDFPAESGGLKPEYDCSYDNSSRCAEKIDLYDALKRLSAEDRKIVQLRYFQGLKLEEIADVTGLKLSTVKSRLYRAIEKLRFAMTP